MPVLTRFGQSDVAYDLVTQTTLPSWGYMLKNGATTIWELWSNKVGMGMNSHNHPAFGSVGQWLYQALVGINLEPDHPGYERIRIQPQTVRDLEWVSGSMNTIRGLIASSWKRTSETLTLDVTIPVGSEADIVIPKPARAVASSSNEYLKGLPPEFTIREGDGLVWQNGFKPGRPGIRSARDVGRAVEFVTGSGHYVFELQQAQ